MRLSPLIIFVSLLVSGLDAQEPPAGLRPIPDRLVVLTFDDASRSHSTIVGPILKRYGFSATFFVTEGFDFKTNKQDYLTWDQIRGLHEDGFEIGNHTRDHLGITDKTVAQLAEQLVGIDQQCEANGIPRPVTFAWPGNAISAAGLTVLAEHGIQFARRGGAPEYPYDEGRGFAYEPQRDHPLLIPSAGDARPTWTLPNFVRAVEQAKDGRIAVVQFHGIPDTAHDWVSLDQQNFEAFMRYLAVHDYQVIALRDLASYVDPGEKPKNHLEVIESRQRRLKASASTR